MLGQFMLCADCARAKVSIFGVILQPTELMRLPTFMASAINQITSVNSTVTLERKAAGWSAFFARNQTGQHFIKSRRLRCLKK